MPQIETTESHSLPILANTVAKPKSKHEGNDTFSKAYQAEEQQPSKGKRERVEDGLKSDDQPSSGTAERHKPGDRVERSARVGTTISEPVDDQVVKDGELFLPNLVDIEQSTQSEEQPKEELAQIVIADAVVDDLSGMTNTTRTATNEPGLVRPEFLRSADVLVADPQGGEESLEGQSKTNLVEGPTLLSKPPAQTPMEAADIKPTTKAARSDVLATASDLGNRLPPKTGSSAERPVEVTAQTQPLSGQTSQLPQIKPGIEQVVPTTPELKATADLPVPDPALVEPDIDNHLPRPERAFTDAVDMPKPKVGQPVQAVALPSAAPASVQSNSASELSGLIGEMEPLSAGETSLPRERLSAQSTGPALSLQPGTAAARIVLGQFTAGLQKFDDGVIEIRLNPAELGRVTIQITDGSTGALASVSADRPDVLELLRRNEALINSEFESAGFANMDFEFSDSDLDNQDAEADREQQGSQSPSQAAMTFVQSEIAPRTIGQTDLDIRL